MGRAPCCDKANVKKGPWSPEEDSKLKDFIEKYGTGGNWIALPHKAGLKRCGKSCRLRWLNYLRPNIKHGEFTDDEDRIICSLFANIGSRWSIIASHLPGRTDNDIKNYWNTKLKKRLLGALPTQRKLQQQQQQQQQVQPPLPSLLEALTPSQKSLTGPAVMPVSSDLFNTTSSMSQTQEGFPLQLHHSYQMNDGVFMFGGEQSCSSSDGSCSYSKENGFQCGASDQVGFESYFYSGFEDGQKLLLGGADKGNGLNAMWGGEVPMDYGFDVIKEVISTNPSNNEMINDGNLVRGNKNQGRGPYYY